MVLTVGGFQLSKGVPRKAPGDSFWWPSGDHSLVLLWGPFIQEGKGHMNFALCMWGVETVPITRKFGKNISDSERLPILKGRGQLYRIADIFLLLPLRLGLRGRWGEKDKIRCMILCAHFPWQTKKHPPKKPQIFIVQTNMAYSTKLYMTLHPIL